jgi:Ca2+-binding EF-hand superfamily protein
MSSSPAKSASFPSPGKIPGPQGVKGSSGGGAAASANAGGVPFGNSNAHRLQNELTPEQQADIAEAFALLDVDGCGTIHAKDLKVALRALGYEPHRDKVKKLVSEVDRESMSNTLMAKEFEHILKTKFFEQDNEEEIDIAFPLFTQGKGDFITIEDLRRVAAEIGEGGLDDDVLEEMVREADVLDHDGKISRDEFFRVMKRQNAYSSAGPH